jgi:demethylmenaquinone methyltransferase / 2-methoxy-6-polyprenyl-1,4-benzoquinol methylase
VSGPSSGGRARTPKPSLDGAFGSPERKRRYVRRLFATIADRYDFITRFLSFGQDRRWKARLIALAGIGPGTRVLDLACGTGDLAIGAAGRGALVVGLDITPRMVELARAKPVSGQPARWCVGDMGALPVSAGAVDVVTTGYGLRNVPDLPVALAEMYRVLAPGGRVAALDFDRPESHAVRLCYLGYLTVVGAALGWVLHGDMDTYRYIPASIRRYPGGRGVAALFREAGFAEVRHVPVFGGLMAFHLARKGGHDERS